MPLRIVKKILIILNVFAVLSLFLAYVSLYINPNITVIPAFFGLAFPYIFLSNLLLMVVWTMYSPWRILISGVAILLGINHFSSFVQINGGEIGKKDENSTEGAEIKVLSYNVRLFDLYNWTKNLDTRNKIFNVLDRENADILCFQEFFFAKNDKSFDTRDTLIKFLNALYYHEGYTHRTSLDHYFGVFTLSKYPIINKGKIVFESDPNNLCIYTDIKIHNDTLRVYNTHLSSIRLQEEDYRLINVLGGKQVIGIGKAKGAIFKRISNAFKKRVEQTGKIVKDVQECSFPLIVCGDFNDSPMSYCYNQFDNILIDSFKEGGQGVGNTYVGIFPSLRIDYIFHNSKVKTREFNILPEVLSDHLALTSKMLIIN